MRWEYVKNTKNQIKYRMDKRAGKKHGGVELLSTEEFFKTISVKDVVEVMQMVLTTVRNVGAGIETGNAD